MSSSITFDQVPPFYYSIPFANFQEINETHMLDIDTLLATPAEGLQTKRTLRKWRRIIQSTRQQLLNARIAYAADRCSTKNIKEFQQYSIEYVSIPKSLYNSLEMAKAEDETNRRRRVAKQLYIAQCKAIMETRTTESKEAIADKLADAKDAYLRSYCDAFVLCKMLFD